MEMKINFYETNKRSLAKTITYRLYQSFLITPLLVYTLTGNLILSFKFSILEIVVKIPAYYLFERIWSLTKHGYKSR